MVVGITRSLFPAATVTSGVTNVTDGAVELGTDARVNELGLTCYGVFFENVAGKIATGTYIGTGADFAVTGMGFAGTNAFIVVQPASSSLPSIHTPVGAADSGQTFESAESSGGAFKSLDADGFTVDNNLSTSGATYYWFAINETANLFNSVGWTGNTTDNTSITGAGFEPDFAIVKCRNVAVNAFLRFAANVGDQSADIIFDFTTNAIQDFEADGVQLGTNDNVNVTGRTYAGLFFKSMAGHMEQATWTGTGATQTISLSINPAFGIIKAGDNRAVLWITFPPAGAEEEVTDFRLMLADVAAPDVPVHNITAQDFSEVGGTLVRFERGRDSTVPGNPPRAGEASVQLYNVSMGNYGLDEPNEGIAIRLNKKYDTTWYHHFQGNIRVPAHSIRPNTITPMVSLRAIGSIAKLQNKTISTELYESVTTGTAIGHALDAASFPAHLRDIDTGDVTLPYWWASGESAMSAITKLLNAEGPTAELYEDGQGRIVFRDRTARYDESRSTDIQSTITSEPSSLNIQSFVYESGSIDSIVNYAEARRIARTNDTVASVVWTDSQGEHGSYILAPPGFATNVLVLEAVATEPFFDAITPVLNTDYAVGFGSVSVTLERTSGQRTRITFTAGAAGASIGPASGNDGIQLRATTTIAVGPFIEISQVDAASSIALYGYSPWQGEMWADMDWADMRANLDAIVQWYKEPRGRITVGIQALESATANEAVAKREIGDRIRVVESALDFDGECWIERISGEIRAPAASDDGDPTGWEMYVYECAVVSVAVGSEGSGLGEENPYDEIPEWEGVPGGDLSTQGMVMGLAGVGVIAAGP